MPISVTCAACEKRYQVKDELAGKKIRCPECQGVIPIGRPASKAVTAKPRPSSDSPVVKRVRPVPVFEDEDHDDDADDDDEFDELPRRRKVLRQPAEEPAKKKKKKRRPAFEFSELPWELIIGGIIGFFALVSAGLSFLFPLGAVLIAGGLFFVGWALGFVGSIALMVMAFQEEVTCGLMFLFVPFYGFYYLVTRWDDVQPFGKCLAGGICVQMVSVGLLGLIGAVAGG